jgi:hypothetical protein
MKMLHYIMCDVTENIAKSKIGQNYIKNTPFQKNEIKTKLRL